MKDMRRILLGHVVIAGAAGKPPFAGIPPAPRSYWRLLEECLRLSAEIESDPLWLGAPSEIADQLPDLAFFSVVQDLSQEPAAAAAQG